MCSKNLRPKRRVLFTILLVLCVVFLLVIWIFKQSETTKEAVEEVAVSKPIETIKKEKDTATKEELVIDVPEVQEYDSIENIVENNSDIVDIFESPDEIQKETIPQKELSSIYIPQTKSILSRKNLTDDQISGKIYYQGENGRLESFIHLDEEGATHEYLVSYNPFSQPVDSLKIGYWNPNTNNKKYATLSVNKISVFENEIRVTEYFINPHMQIRKGRSFSKLP